MLTRLDHLVILAYDLDRTVDDYRRLGFAVTPGGEHADGLTRNALVPFGDGSYLELVSFLDPEDGRDNVWGWREFLPQGGLVDYCAASDDLRADVGRLGSFGFGVDGPSEGGRRLPGGDEVRWLSARVRQEGRVLPFLIEDLTPRELRVPGGPSAEHPNGATGISSVEISAPDPEMAARSLVALAGASDDSGASPHPGTSVRLGACTLRFVERGREAGGPMVADLAADVSGGTLDLDGRLTRGVRIRLAPGVP